MKFSYNFLKEYLSGKLPTPEKLAEILMFHSFEVESVEKKGKDAVLDIKVLSNRGADCFSHIGIAREIAALTGCKLKMPDIKVKQNKKQKALDLLKVQVENQNDCPRYTASIVQNVRVGESPREIKEKIEACGLQSINNIVDITNYVMLETGQPLHAFDLAKLNGQIIVRRAKKGEKIKTLDKEKKEYILNENILVIADSASPIAIAGIKGGEASGISKDTKNIVIEAANFNSGLIRAASQKLKLKTDASVRFENGLDINLIDFAQQRVLRLIEKYAKGEAASEVIDKSVKKPLPGKINLSLGYLEKLLGIKMPNKEVEKIFKSLGFVVSQQSGDKMQIKAPTNRLDIQTQEDLIEEVARIWGYDKIPSLKPKIDLTTPQRNDNLFWQTIAKNALKELGLIEVYNYSFLGEAEKEIYNFSDQELMALENPMSSYNRYLRPSLMPGFLQNIKDNFRWSNQIKLFEVGKIFKKKNQGHIEKLILGGVLSKKGEGDTAFYELKGILDALFSCLGIANVWYDEVNATPDNSNISLWHPGKTAEIKVNDKEIGFLGQVHPSVLEKMALSEKVFMFEIDFVALLKLTAEEKEYQEISMYPSSLRDISILAPQGTKLSDIQIVIENAGGEILRDTELFDTYTGETIGEDMENFAFHLVFQSPERTLSSKEVDEAFAKISQALDEKGWQIRK